MSCLRKNSVARADGETSGRMTWHRNHSSLLAPRGTWGLSPPVVGCRRTGGVPHEPAHEAQERPAGRAEGKGGRCRGSGRARRCCAPGGAIAPGPPTVRRPGGRSGRGRGRPLPPCMGIASGRVAFGGTAQPPGRIRCLLCGHQVPREQRPVSAGHSHHSGTRSAGGTREPVLRGGTGWLHVMTTQTASRRAPAGTARPPIGSPQPAGERVLIAQDVVETLLSRADLLSQLLRIGYARGPQGQEA